MVVLVGAVVWKVAAEVVVIGLLPVGAMVLVLSLWLIGLSDCPGVG